MAIKKTKAPKKAPPRKVATGPSDASAISTPEAHLGKAIVVYTKSSSHSLALVDPKVVALGGLLFIEGTQVTGKSGHRLEGKRTCIACDHVASFIEFASEEDIWSEPQSKMIRPLLEQEDKGTVLTLHEQGQSLTPRHGHQRGGHFGGHEQGGRRHRHRRNRGNHGPTHG